MKLLRRIISEEYPFLCAAPALIWQSLFLFIPLCAMGCFSFLNLTPAPGESFLTFAHYARVLHPVYIKVILNSLILAVLTVAITLLIAYPVAYFLAFKVKRARTLLLFLIILPSWTNIVVQAYSWFFLLEKGGLLSQWLSFIGLSFIPFHVLNTYAATLIGMVYCFLPFMILPIYSSLEKMDKRLLEASADLGAHWLHTFRWIVLPLSFPGISVGVLLVGIPSFGEFVIPSLLGGGHQMYWGNLIVQKFLVLQDWAAGFALVTLGIFCVIVSVLLLNLALRVGRRVKNNATRAFFEIHK